MYLYFKNSRAKLTFVCECEADEAADKIKEYVANKYPHFKIYYIRCMTTDDGITHYDVGSHSEFFWLCPKKMYTDKQYEYGM